MKRCLLQTFLEVYTGIEISLRYIQCLANEWREAKDNYGFSPYTTQDFRSRLAWIQENIEGVMDKFHRDVVAEMVEKGWREPE